MAWTDERLDDLAERTHGEIRDIRTEMRDMRIELRGEMSTLRTELRGDIGSLRTELKGDIGSLRTELKGDIGGLRTELKGDIHELRAVMFRFGVAIMVCMAGVIATLIGAIVTGSIGG